MFSLGENRRRDRIENLYLRSKLCFFFTITFFLRKHGKYVEFCKVVIAELIINSVVLALTLLKALEGTDVEK